MHSRPSVPKKHRPNSAGRLRRSGRNDVRLRSMRMTMKMSATKLRKKAFSNAGRSPASFTNMDMSEKPNAAMRT